MPLKSGSSTATTSTTRRARGLLLFLPLAMERPNSCDAHRASTRSPDARAFGVLSCRTLSLVHPLIGDSICERPAEREERAFAGAVPWVDDPSDRSNSCSERRTP
jgi:hypothetical protein